MEKNLILIWIAACLGMVACSRPVCDAVPPPEFRFVVIDRQSQSVITSDKQVVKLYYYQQQQKKDMADLKVETSDNPYGFLLTSTQLVVVSGNLAIKRFYLEAVPGDVDTVDVQVDTKSSKCGNMYTLNTIMFNGKASQQIPQAIYSPAFYILKK